MTRKVKFNSYISWGNNMFTWRIGAKNTFARKYGAKNAVINST